MYTLVQKRNRAINLRKEGRSYNEILEEVKVSKGTLSEWLSDIKLNETQKRDLNERSKGKVARGRLNALITNRARRITNENKVYAEAEQEFYKYIKDPFFTVGITLYWSKGTKGNQYFNFISSNPEMVILMGKWLRKYINIEEDAMKYRLYSYSAYKNDNIEKYWCHVLGIQMDRMEKTSYKVMPAKMKKNAAYKGSLAIFITRINVLRRMIAWQKLLIQYYSEVQR